MVINSSALLFEYKNIVFLRYPIDLIVSICSVATRIKLEYDLSNADYGH